MPGSVCVKPGPGCVPSQNGTVRRYQELEAATGAQSKLEEEKFLPVQVKNISTVFIAMLQRPQHRHLGNHWERNLVLKAVCVTSEQKTCLMRAKKISPTCFMIKNMTFVTIPALLSCSVIGRLFSNVKAGYLSDRRSTVDVARGGEMSRRAAPLLLTSSCGCRR